MYINGLSSVDLITSKPFVMVIFSIELKLLSNTMWRRVEPYADGRIFRLLYYEYVLRDRDNIITAEMINHYVNGQLYGS